MKYCKIGISIISIIVAAICVIMIVRINKAFPNAEENSYTKDNPANIEGVELTPVSYNVYTIEEYSKISPTNNFSMNQNSDNSRIIVMTVMILLSLITASLIMLLMAYLSNAVFGFIINLVIFIISICYMKWFFIYNYMMMYRIHHVYNQWKWGAGLIIIINIAIIGVGIMYSRRKDFL